LITKKGYSTNQNLETNLNHPTRNPPPKKFLYKPQHFEHSYFHSSQSLR